MEPDEFTEKYKPTESKVAVGHPDVCVWWVTRSAGPNPDKSWEVKVWDLLRMNSGGWGGDR